MVTLNWYVCKYRVHKLHQRYIHSFSRICTSGGVYVPGMWINKGYINFLRMYLWWSLCPLYLHTCQGRVTVGNSGLCCCICVMYLQH